MQIQEILGQLKNVKRAGVGRWMAFCCAHSDHNRSLSIREVDGRVLLHCFAGCSYESLASILGIDRHATRPNFAPRPKPQVTVPRPDFASMFDKWNRETDYHFRDGLAMTLGVDSQALEAIGCAWNGQAWAFPMKDDKSNVIGIRLRAMDGKKWAVTGSKQGLFIPSEYPYCIDDSTMYICEGPTDLAAATTIGLYAIGRPSCLGQESMIVSYVRARRPRRVVLITDNDMPGFDGAKKLQSQLKIRSCIYIPCSKDIRELVSRGGDAGMVESNIRNLVWQAA